jgi:RimJ/RimL family protein N-acetyltransferase
MGGEVAADGLATRIKRARALVLLSVGGVIVGVCALKKPLRSYQRDVFAKADAAGLEETFPLELGWVFVASTRGKGLSESLCVAALNAAGQAGVFSTTRTDNEPMRRALERLNFRACGRHYSSVREGNTLQLFVREAPR